MGVRRYILHNTSDLQPHIFVKFHYFTYRVFVAEIFFGSSRSHYNAQWVIKYRGGIAFQQTETKEFKKIFVGQYYFFLIKRNAIIGNQVIIGKNPDRFLNGL